MTAGAEPAIGREFAHQQRRVGGGARLRPRRVRLVLTGAARDVAPGESWAFLDHRCLAEIGDAEFRDAEIREKGAPPW